MTDEVLGARRLRTFESPHSFMRMFMRLAIALTIIGAAGLVDPLIVLPLAGLLVVFAGLAWLTAADVLDDPTPSPFDAVDSADEALDHAVVAQPEPEDLDRVSHRFQLPAAVGAERAWLVGDFNGWSRTDHPMQRDGEWFTTVIRLEPGRTYRYRYLLDDDRWENDWAAESYVPNAYGSDDSVVTT